MASSMAHLWNVNRVRSPEFHHPNDRNMKHENVKSIKKSREMLENDRWGDGAFSSHLLTMMNGD